MRLSISSVTQESLNMQTSPDFPLHPIYKKQVSFSNDSNAVNIAYRVVNILIAII